MSGKGIQFTPSTDQVQETMSRRMSKETAEGLSALAEVVAEQREKAQEVAAAENEAPLPLPKDNEEDDTSPDEDLSGHIVEYANTFVDNPEIRRAVEARCGDIDFNSLVTSGQVQQKVSIKPGLFEVVFQTINGEDDLFIKQQLYQFQGSDSMVVDMYTIMQLSAGTFSINGKQLSAFVNDKGERDTRLFENRWKQVARLPMQLLEALSTNYRWFDLRVRRAIVYDDLKNG
jgi:hypothetical protein